MSKLPPECLSEVAELQARSGRETVAFGAVALTSACAEMVYEVLAARDKATPLDIVLYLRGGEVTAARRIGLLLHEYCDRLRFIVPSRCDSAGTLLALTAHELVAGPMATFSPIDPQLQSAGDGAGPAAISAEDVRAFAAMARDWFGVHSQETQTQLLALLCQQIFPTTLTSFYRSDREVRAVAAELLARGQPELAPEARGRVIEQLVTGSGSHEFPLTRSDLRELGLAVQDAERSDEQLLWALVKKVREHARSLQVYADGSQPRALLATSDAVFVEVQRPVATPVSGTSYPLRPVWCKVVGQKLERAP